MSPSPSLDQEPGSADGPTALLTPMGPRMLLAVPLVVILRFGSSARAQTTSELWPEVDVYWRPALHQRSMVELSSSSEREGDKHEATVGAYQDYLFLPLGYARAGYRFTFSTRDASYRESRGLVETTMAADLTPVWHLADRVRVESRWVNGEFSYRVRDRLHLQRERRPVQAWAFAPYCTAEAYYDSRFTTVARTAGRVGSVLRFSPRQSLDLYVTSQVNSRTTPRTIEALGLTLALTY